MDNSASFSRSKYTRNQDFTASTSLDSGDVNITSSNPSHSFFVSYFLPIWVRISRLMHDRHNYLSYPAHYQGPPASAPSEPSSAFNCFYQSVRSTTWPLLFIISLMAVSVLSLSAFSAYISFESPLPTTRSQAEAEITRLPTKTGHMRLPRTAPKLKYMKTHSISVETQSNGSHRAPQPTKSIEFSAF